MRTPDNLLKVNKTGPVERFLFLNIKRNVTRQYKNPFDLFDRWFSKLWSSILYTVANIEGSKGSRVNSTRAVLIELLVAVTRDLIRQVFES